jgi:hypothetical protein
MSTNEKRTEDTKHENRREKRKFSERSKKVEISSTLAAHLKAWPAASVMKITNNVARFASRCVSSCESSHVAI